MKPASIPALCALLGALSLSGCALFGREAPKLNVSPAIPSAEATAKFGAEKNGNTSIDLKVKHLADPRKLTPPANNYVVWLRAAPTAPAQNIGALTVNKNLEGTLDTVTALKSFDLFVTAEASPQTQQPAGPPLLWTSHTD
jgi:hypothetical protein